MNSINKFIAAAAVIIFPASVLGMDKLHGLVFIIIFLLGLWLLVSDYKNIFPLLKEEKYFFFALSIVMVTVVVTTLVNNTDLARADRFIAPILAIPIYLYFKRYLVDEKYLWIGLVLGALIAASIAVYEMFWLPKAWPFRATGVVNPIIFGDLAMLMGVMSLAGIGWFKAQKKWMVFIPAVAVAAGLLASGLSLVKGAWLALPFLVLLVVWYASKHLKLKVILLAFSLIMLMVGSLYFIPQTGVQNRITDSLTNLDRYLDSQDVNDEARNTSVGIRLEMWKAAGIIFMENPVVGGGWGDYMVKAQVLVDIGLVNKNAAIFYHPHNQFMSALAKGGLLGFLAISLLLLFPSIIFYQSIVHYTSAETQRIALAGLMLIVGFVAFSLTESILERSRSIIYFSFYLATLMALLQASRKKPGRHIINTATEVDEINPKSDFPKGDRVNHSMSGIQVENAVLLEKVEAEVFKCY